MAELIDLKTIVDARGSLTVIERILPFDVKRVYYIYDVSSDRGGHAHKYNKQALVAVTGSCIIHCMERDNEVLYELNDPTKLLLMSDEWHRMTSFSSDCVLLVMASEFYEEDDYVYARKNHAI